LYRSELEIDGGCMTFESPMPHSYEQREALRPQGFFWYTEIKVDDDYLRIELSLTKRLLYVDMEYLILM